MRRPRACSRAAGPTRAAAPSRAAAAREWSKREGRLPRPAPAHTRRGGTPWFPRRRQSVSLCRRARTHPRTRWQARLGGAPRARRERARLRRCRLAERVVQPQVEARDVAREDPPLAHAARRLVGSRLREEGRDAQRRARDGVAVQQQHELVLARDTAAVPVTQHHAAQMQASIQSSGRAKTV
eukprot:1692526-Prymnesium_polylepis.1